MKWHFQETPTDSWDLTATQPMVFTEMEVGGAKRPVILHTPKNGFFFVVDRESGKPLAANALVRTSWASGWDLETGKPKLTPEFSDYSTGPKIVFPASSGARNWHPAAYDPGAQPLLRRGGRHGQPDVHPAGAGEPAAPRELR